MPEYDPNDYEFFRPAEHIKAINVRPIPQRISDDMIKYGITILLVVRLPPTSCEEIYPCELLGSQGFLSAGTNSLGRATEKASL
jgi:hypothetical protein